MAQQPVNSKPDTAISLPKSILKKAIVDIERGDGYKAENKILYQNIKLLENKSSIKDSIITTYTTKEKYYNTIIKNNDEVNKQQLLIQTQLQNEIKSLKRKNTLNKILYGTVAVGVGALLILK